MMSRSEDMAARLGAASDGIVQTVLMALAGVNEEAVGRLRARGLLVRLGPGVFRLRDHPWTWRSRARAALALAGPGAALGLRSAARLHGFYLYRDTDAIEIVVPRGHHRHRNHARVVQTRLLPDEHVTVVDGLRVTTIARTFFDLCGDPDHGLRLRHPAHERRMARVYNDALARRGLRFVHEVAVLGVLAKRGRAGTRLVRRLLERFGAAYEPTHSESESLFVEIVDTFGLPAPDKQVPISDDRGFIGTVDFVWPSKRLVVEVDSAWHDGPIEVENDAERDERLVRAGYTVKRYRYRQLALAPEAVARELESILLGEPTEAAPRTISR